MSVTDDGVGGAPGASPDTAIRDLDCVQCGQPIPADQTVLLLALDRPLHITHSRACLDAYWQDSDLSESEKGPMADRRAVLEPCAACGRRVGRVLDHRYSDDPPTAYCSPAC